MKKHLIAIIILPTLLLMWNCRADSDIVEPKSYQGNDISEVHNLTKIISPEYQKNYRPGSNLTIRWEPTAGVKFVTIHLYKKSEHRGTLIKDYPNSGSYVWKIPENIVRSHHYRIKIQDHQVVNYSTVSPYFFILD